VLHVGSIVEYNTLSTVYGSGCFFFAVKKFGGIVYNLKESEKQGDRYRILL
jgi:hypothetical protein